MLRNDERASVAPWFLLASGAVALLFVAMMLWVASCEWFYADDFTFLNRALSGPRSWWDILLPIEVRWWWSYRPLSIELFYGMGVRWFGLSAFPFLAANVANFLLASLLLGRIARQIGFSRQGAVFCALLLLTMHSSNVEIFWVSVFQHTSARVFVLLSVTTYLEALRSGRIVWNGVSLASMLLGLLCNELTVLLPASLLLLGTAFGCAEGEAIRPTSLVGRAVCAVRMAAPQIVMAIAFAVFRWMIIAEPTLKKPFEYYMGFGWHIALNIAGYLWLLVHENLLKAMCTGIFLCAAWWVSLQQRGSQVLSDLALRALTFFAWLCVTMVPFVGFLYAHSRLAMSLEAPAVLLMGAHFEAIRSSVGTGRGRLVDLVVLFVVVMWFPYGTLIDRARGPLGEAPRGIAEALANYTTKRGECVLLRLQDAEKWGADDRFTLRFQTGGLLSALHPGQAQPLWIGEPPPGRNAQCIEIFLERIDGPRRRFLVRHSRRL